VQPFEIGMVRGLVTELVDSLPEECSCLEHAWDVQFRERKITHKMITLYQLTLQMFK
jgi:hypothetical protein